MGNTDDPGGRDDVSTKQRRIAELARKHPERCFTSLAHHVDGQWLLQAFRRTRKDGAAGVDGQTAEEYGQDLEENLHGLEDRAKSGSYKAPPVRRGWIPKGDRGEKRPIGIPSFEDKVLQRAVAMLLEPIYEQDFLDCSYGFRPGRGAHQALEALWRGIQSMGGGWVLDVDVSKFYDTLQHRPLREFLAKRVGDGVVRRLLHKWLKAGVWEDEQVRYPEEGTPQGGVISPLLSNLYLHEVLDAWFVRDVLPRMRGRAFMVRYADDFVLCFEREEDARRVMEVLPKRFARYGLTIHPEKTRLARFGRPRGRLRPETFDFLGFTHYWGKSRKGQWVVKRKTARKRLGRAIRKMAQWCRRNRHLKVREQHRQLGPKLLGHYQYYGITGNAEALRQFRHRTLELWRKWLDRRGGKKKWTWERFQQLLQTYSLPPIRVCHSVYRAKPSI